MLWKQIVTVVVVASNRINEYVRERSGSVTYVAFLPKKVQNSADLTINPCWIQIRFAGVYGGFNGFIVYLFPSSHESSKEILIPVDG